MSFNIDCEGTELQTGDVIEDLITGELYTVSSKQDSLPMVRVRSYEDSYRIVYYRPEAIRLVERPRLRGEAWWKM
jgi:hypothetical protein